MSSPDRTRASESVAVSFTRVMNATPSPFGVLSDPGLSGVLSAVIVVVGLIAVSQGSGPTVLPWILAAGCAPFLVTIVASLALRSARARVVDWMAGVPFAIDNLNALLAGVGDTIEVVFASGVTLPERSTFQPMLDAVSEEIVLLGSRPDESLIAIRLGVADSKRNPFGSNHRRWQRLKAVVGEVLVPLCRTSPIVTLRVV